MTQHKESWASGRTYAHDPNVIFDIFNEPRADAACAGHGPYNMLLWRNGGQGTCGSNQPVYQGMDAVAYHIRTYDHAASLLWAEGPGAASTLAGMDRGCQPAATSVHNFLAYLQTIGVGISAYQLSAGYLLKANEQWTDTTNYTDHPWSDSYCTYVGGQTAPPPPLLGAGADILSWFRQQN